MIWAVLNTVSALPFTMVVRCSPSRRGRILLTSRVPSDVLITARCMVDCGLRTPLIALASPPLVLTVSAIAPFGSVVVRSMS